MRLKLAVTALWALVSLSCASQEPPVPAAGAPAAPETAGQEGGSASGGAAPNATAGAAGAPQGGNPAGSPAGAGAQASNSDAGDAALSDGATGEHALGDGGAGADGGVDAAAGAGAAAEVCPRGQSFGDPLPPPDQRQASSVRGGFNFLEGPVWHAELGALFFSDMNMSDSGADGIASRIHRLTPPSSFEVFVPDSGSNGLALGLDGKLLAATHDEQTLSSYDPTSGARQTHQLTYMGKAFNSPNDLTVRSDGTVYFTDPDWQLPPRSSQIGFTGVYRWNPGGQIHLIDDTLDKPNGIALSPDERTLYVSSAGPAVLAYPLDAAGVAGTPEVIASPGGSDGMTVDCAGNLYITAGAVLVLDPSGNELGRIQVAESPSNVAFGGADRKTLYITARSGLYAIPLNVPGYPY